MVLNRLKKVALTFTIAGVMTFSALPVEAALGDTVLKHGMYHEDIQGMQELLKFNGFYQEEETNTYFGDLTLQAILELQKSQNLQEDGIFGPATYDALMALTLEKFSIEESEEAVTILDIQKLEYGRALKYRDEGDDVQKLQEALKGLGYLDIENTTNFFGTQTEQALIQFQKSYGISVDGIAGPGTIDTINEALAGKKPVAPSRGDSGDRSLTINLIATAKKYLGTRYVFGGSTPKGFDCSGFTSYVYRQHGISLPRSTVDQAKLGEKINKANLRAGDLLIFSNTYKKGPSHAGIYLGDGTFIHASSSGKGVIISDLNSAYYSSKFSYGQRVY